MDRLSYFESFLEVLDQGSLSAAARVRGVSQPAISQQMAALEADFGTALLQRSSSGTQPTRAGAIVARLASDIVTSHKRMRTEISALKTEASGTLKISVSKIMAENAVGLAIQDLHTTYPEIQLTVKVEDRLVDVVKEGYDLALRTGDIGVHDAVVRKIGQFETVLVAAPNYLDRVGRPASHTDVAQHAFIQYAEHRVHGYHRVSRNGEDAEVALVPKLVVDTPSHLIHALTGGIGFACMPKLLIQDLIDDGSLEVMLPDYYVHPKNIYIVYPHRHAVTEATRVVIDAIYRGLQIQGSTRLVRHQDLAAGNHRMRDFAES